MVREPVGPPGSLTFHRVIYIRFALRHSRFARHPLPLPVTLLVIAIQASAARVMSTRTGSFGQQQRVSLSCEFDEHIIIPTTDLSNVFA